MEQSCYALNINRLIRDGVFDAAFDSGSIQWVDPQTGEQTSTIGYEVNLAARYFGLRYRRVHTGETLDYKVALTSTQLAWGADRWWFVCPLAMDGRSCERRVAKLYLPPGARYYGCRHCYQLTYRSCQISGLFRAVFQQRRRERRIELHADRNEQRRRRRKARHWS